MMAARVVAVPVLLALLVAAGARAQTPPPAGDVYLLDDEFVGERVGMVERYLAPEIGDERVLAAMRQVPRHRFVPRWLWSRAYHNRPLPIGEGQTISQPFVVALMTELLQLDSDSKVLEIGTGSGYQAAVLAEVAGEVFSIEILPGVAKTGAENLKAAGYHDVHLRVGDGYLGWPEAAPFDGIIVTCAPDHVPGPLQEQLAEGGRLVIPVGERGAQELVVLEKREGKLVRWDVIPVRFVPMTGLAEEDPSRRPPPREPED